ERALRELAEYRPTLLILRAADEPRRVERGERLPLDAAIDLLLHLALGTLFEQEAVAVGAIDLEDNCARDAVPEMAIDDRAARAIGLGEQRFELLELRVLESCPGDREEHRFADVEREVGSLLQILHGGHDMKEI